MIWTNRHSSAEQPCDQPLGQNPWITHFAAVTGKPPRKSKKSLTGGPTFDFYLGFGK
jgi:hypothetical protein